jgi:low affinity Fe/Cu permease
MKDVFRKIATKVSSVAGSATTFLFAFLLVVLWASTGPTFNFSDTWQLVINTGTTIVTFLMVFLIQNTQNRDSKAMQLKLDELIRVTRARDTFVDLESLTDAELAALDGEFRELREKLATSPAMKKLHDTIEAEHAKRQTLRSGLTHIAGQVGTLLGVPKPETKPEQKPHGKHPDA